MQILGNSHTGVIVAALGATVIEGIDADALLNAVKEGRFHAHHLSTSCLQVLKVPRPPPSALPSDGMSSSGGGGGAEIFTFSGGGTAASAGGGGRRGSAHQLPSLLPGMTPPSPEPRTGGLAASGTLTIKSHGHGGIIQEPDAKKRKQKVHHMHGFKLRVTPPPPAATSEGTGTEDLCKVITTEISKTADPADPGTNLKYVSDNSVTRLPTFLSSSFVFVLVFGFSFGELEWVLVEWYSSIAYSIQGAKHLISILLRSVASISANFC